MYMLNPMLQKKLYKLQEKGMKMNSENFTTRDPTRNSTSRNSTSGDPTILEDAQQVSFLKMLGWRIIPMIELPVDPTQKVDPNTLRVNFWMYGDKEQLKKDLQRYYDNEAFPIQDFCRHLKDIKSQMYALRRMKK